MVGEGSHPGGEPERRGLTFGVPGLGLQRGLGENLVVAPYASAMAVMLAPETACDKAMQPEDPTSGVYMVSDGAEHRWEDFCLALAQALGRTKPAVVPVPEIAGQLYPQPLFVAAQVLLVLGAFRALCNLVSPAEFEADY